MKALFMEAAVLGFRPEAGRGSIVAPPRRDVVADGP